MKKAIAVTALLFIFSALIGIAQAPTGLSRMSAYYKLAGSPSTATPTYGWVYLDWPLQIAKDASGYAHLKVDPLAICIPRTDDFTDRTDGILDYHLSIDQPGQADALHPYIPPSVFINGLLGREGADYTYDPVSHVITIASVFANSRVTAKYCTIRPTFMILLGPIQ